jgi:hypothetical protein
MRIFIILFLIISSSFIVKAQSDIENVTTQYIAAYKNLAVSEQVRSGVPAAITIAQGIYESASGLSILAVEANNHFGIKCKNTWTGETILHDDDAVQECFRKYKTAGDSYRDHSDFLKNNRRYSFLFDIPITNYQEWAVGLRKAGYATNTKYSTKIVEIIQKYDLQKFTIDGQRLLTQQFNESKEAEEEKIQAQIEADEKAKEEKKIAAQKKKDDKKKSQLATLEEGPKTNQKSNTEENATELNGLKGFYAKKGTGLLKYAILNEVRYARLLEWNDLPDEPLSEDMFIYLERKDKKSDSKRIHIVTENETMIGIAQKEGIQLKSLKQLNLLEDDEMPIVGTKLTLQSEASRKPKLRTNNNIEAPKEIIVNSTESKTSKEVKNNDVDIASNLFVNSSKKVEVVEEVLTPEKVTEEIKIVEKETIEKEANSITSNTINVDKVKETDKVKIKEAIQDLGIEMSNTASNIVVEEVIIPEIKAKKVEVKFEKENNVNQIENIKIESKPVVKENYIDRVEIPNVPIVKPKSPSNYNEPNTSAEIRALKKVMDEIVYMAPLPKKIPKVVDTVKVSKPITKPSSELVKQTTKPKTTTNNAIKIKQDTIVTKSSAKATVTAPKTTIVNATKPTTKIKETAVNKAGTKPATKQTDKGVAKNGSAKVADKKVLDKKINDKKIIEKNIIDKKAIDKKVADKKETVKKEAIKKGAEKPKK